MKKIPILSLMVALLAFTTSCREEFLQTEPTETVSNPSAQFKLNGLYLLMVNTATGGTTGHDDFGQKAYDIYKDLLSSDMVLAGVNYGWYSNIANYSDPVDFTRNTNYIPWRYYYRLIYAANDVIEGLGGNDAQLTSTKDKAAMGQAKAIRAHSYFNLVQMYTPKYDPSAKSIPIYKMPTPESGARAAQSEVYAFMIEDLTNAISLLDGFARPNKGTIDKNVAKGMLAYVYAAQGDYAKVVTVAGELVNGGLPITTAGAATGGFNSLSAPSWMWGFDVTLDNSLDLISWWGQTDVFTYSYAWAGDPKAIDENLFNAIRADDIRKNQFITVVEFDEVKSVVLDATGNPVLENGVPIKSITNYPKGYVIESAFFDPTDPNRNEYMKVSFADISYSAVPGGKFYDPKKIVGGQRVIETDYLYMRSDEFHMLYAEALAKTGQTALAKTAYKNFLSNRLTDTSYVDGLSDAALKADIYTNTRIEFWGEGKSYFAMKRNMASVTRGANHLFFVGQSFSYDDNRLYLKIPQAEVIANPNL